MQAFFSKAIFAFELNDLEVFGSEIFCWKGMRRAFPAMDEKLHAMGVS